MARKDARAEGARRTGWWRETWVKITAGVALVGVLAVGITAAYIARNAEPILRKRVVDTLSARFHSPVELDHLDISVVRGIEVRGTGLRIFYLAGPTKPDAAQLQGQPAKPMLSVHEFNFRSTLDGLMRSPTRVATVYVKGLEVHIPPANGTAQGAQPKQPKLAFLVDRIVAEDAKLFVETSKPGKDPLEFDIPRIVLTDVGADKPFVYDALVTNPKPRGNVHATGHFGPWMGADPRETAIDGDYTFDDADLSTIKGIAGTLSSRGHFAGQLGHITADGTTETPNFSLDVSNHPLPLQTKFHAIVDGTTGDTTLDPVEAVLAHTPIEARGTVMQVHGQGHDIALDVKVASGRIEDLLELGMKTNPPVLRGGVAVAAKLHIPPGPERVPRKMQLAGSIKVQKVEFTNTQWQDKLDGLSMRAQGRPEDARAAESDRKPEVASQLTTNFSLDRGLMTFDSVDYKLPGAEVMLDGAYSMDGSVFEFKGHVKTEATASEMVTGWKSLLLKPVDKFLKKNGAGMELPIEVSGAKGDMKMGLDLGGAKATPQQMAAEVKAKGKEQHAASTQR